MDLEILPATEPDIQKIQELRKICWQDNYINPETEVTEEVLQTQLAKLPVSESDISYFRDHMLSNPENSPSNLVAKSKILSLE